MENSTLPPKPTEKPWLCKLWFKDHCRTENGVNYLVSCRVWGVCFEETGDALILCYWSADGKFCEANCETLTIGKGLVDGIDWVREELETPRLASC